MVCREAVRPQRRDAIECQHQHISSMVEEKEYCSPKYSLWKAEFITAAARQIGKDIVIILEIGSFLYYNGNVITREKQQFSVYIKLYNLTNAEIAYDHKAGALPFTGRALVLS